MKQNTSNNTILTMICIIFTKTKFKYDSYENHARNGKFSSQNLP